LNINEKGFFMSKPHIIRLLKINNNELFSTELRDYAAKRTAEENIEIKPFDNSNDLTIGADTREEAIEVANAMLREFSKELKKYPLTP